jgi:uncharacterized protein (TIGR03083 family)
MSSPEPTTDLDHARGIWSVVHAERAALAADLEHLTDQQWATRSLCAEFTVRQVLAHLTAGASLNRVRWLAGVIRCRFDFDKHNAMRLAEELGATPAETLARFRRAVTSTTKAPVPTAAVLGETIVHGEDIRQPLGINRDYPITTPAGWLTTTRALTSSSPPEDGSPAYDWKPVTGPLPPARGYW